MHVSRKMIAAGLMLLGLATGTASAQSTEAPDSTIHSKRDVSNVIVITTACPGFAASSPLHFGGTLVSQYRRWSSPDVVDPIDEGFTLAHVTAADGIHTFRITQRYDFPRGFREFVYGWATTRVVRDDGATMVGASWLGIDTTYPGGGAEGVWWTQTPTCNGPRH